MGDLLGSLVWGAKSGQYCVIGGRSLQVCSPTVFHFIVPKDTQLNGLVERCLGVRSPRVFSSAFFSMYMDIRFQSNDLMYPSVETHRISNFS